MNDQVLEAQVNSLALVVAASPILDHGDENLMEEPRYQASTVTGISSVDGVAQTVPTMVESVPYARADSPTPLVSLLTHQESEAFRLRWNEIQSKFIDEPRSAVQQADGLVLAVVDNITKMFFREHGNLELQWKQGGEASTEDLRQALQHYRSFFNRLVG